MIIPKPAIRALPIGSNRCDMAGITAYGRMPVTKLCRILIEAGYDPGRPLHAYRGDVLSLRVRTIGQGSQLIVKTAGSGCPIFALAGGAAASPVRKTARPVGDIINLEETRPEG